MLSVDTELYRAALKPKVPALTAGKRSKRSAPETFLRTNVDERFPAQPCRQHRRIVWALFRHVAQHVERWRQGIFESKNWLQPFMGIVSPFRVAAVFSRGGVEDIVDIRTGQFGIFAVDRDLPAREQARNRDETSEEIGTCSKEAPDDTRQRSSTRGEHTGRHFHLPP